MESSEQSSTAPHSQDVPLPTTVAHQKETPDELELDELRSKRLVSAYERVESLTNRLGTHYGNKCVEPVVGHAPSNEENTLNAWAWRCDLKKETEDNSLLKGREIAIKDNICVAGLPMQNGSVLMREYKPQQHATVVNRILENGGNIIGKSNCENFSFSPHSFTSDLGAVRNPHSPLHSAGGSSSGSAALVSSGVVSMALGGDQGGSVRIPSSWCGIVGLKPTWGLVPYTGAAILDPTIDHLGPITSNVYDCALLLHVIGGRDDEDGRQPTTLPSHLPTYHLNLSTECEGVRIGMVREGFDMSDEGVAGVVRRALQAMESEGAVVTQVSVPLHRDGGTIYRAVTIEGSRRSMMLHNGVARGYKGYYNTSLHDYMSNIWTSEKCQQTPPILKHTSFVASYLDRYMHMKGHYYSLARNLTFPLTSAYDEVLSDYDVLAMPTLPILPRRLPETNMLGVKDYLSEVFCGVITNTCPFNLTGHPAITVNAGFTSSSPSDGDDCDHVALPVGIMFVGKKWDEQKVLDVAAAWEKIRPKYE